MHLRYGRFEKEATRPGIEIRSLSVAWVSPIPRCWPLLIIQRRQRWKRVGKSIIARGQQMLARPWKR